MQWGQVRNIYWRKLKADTCHPVHRPRHHLHQQSSLWLLQSRNQVSEGCWLGIALHASSRVPNILISLFIPLLLARITVHIRQTGISIWKCKEWSYNGLSRDAISFFLRNLCRCFPIEISSNDSFFAEFGRTCLDFTRSDVHCRSGYEIKDACYKCAICVGSVWTAFFWSDTEMGKEGGASSSTSKLLSLMPLLSMDVIRWVRWCQTA